MSITVSPKDLPAELRRRTGMTREAVARGIRSGARRAKALMVLKTPKDTGHMKLAWRDNVSHGRESFEAVQAEVFNDAPYAGIVEMGARPHTVNKFGRFAILEWVRRHMPGLSDKEQMRVRDAIVHKLATKGQAPTYFVRDSRPKIVEGTRAEVTRAIRESAGRSTR